MSSGLLTSSGDDSATLDPMSFDISEIYLPSFSTFPESALTMFRAMFGDFDFNEFSGVRCGANTTVENSQFAGGLL